jgi:predicted AAA+ superfamily ATPase
MVLIEIVQPAFPPGDILNLVKEECHLLIRSEEFPDDLVDVLKGLSEAMEKFTIPKGYILTLDEEEEIEILGKMVRVIPLWKWLLTS